MAVHKKYSRNVLGRGLDDIDGGKGLDALFDNAGARTEGTSTINEIPLSQIEANPNQPRREFDAIALEELAASIREIGIIQPITLRQIADENVMEMALIENIQREDLNAIEIALAYEHLLDAEGMTQEKVSERVGKSRTAITNYLRLLRLPAQVQIALQKREIDMGHARALLAVESPSLQIKLFNEVIKNGYSVRKVEEMAQMLKNGEDVDSGKKKIVAKAKLPEEYNALRSHLSDFLQTKVQMTCSPKGKGKITIPFANEEELERIMSAFDKMKQQ